LPSWSSASSTCTGQPHMCAYCKLSLEDLVCDQILFANTPVSKATQHTELPSATTKLGCVLANNRLHEARFFVPKM
jgi:hypothetical protein